MKILPLSVLAFLACLSVPASAQNGGLNPPPAADKPAADKPAGAKAEEAKPDEAAALIQGKGVGELVTLLGHARHRVRQAAEARLKELAAENTEEVENACYQAYAKDPDPEIHMRARNILLQIVPGLGTSNGRGYVGVELHLHAYFDVKGDLRFAVRVNKVMPGTPASAAGLKEGDLVTGLDTLDLNNPDGDRRFMSYVAGKGPDKQIVLRLERDGKNVQQPLVLARRPILFNNVRPSRDPEAVFQDYLKRKAAEAQPAPAPSPAPAPAPADLPPKKPAGKR